MDNFIDDDDEIEKNGYSWVKKYKYNFSVLEQDTKEFESEELLTSEKERKKLLDQSHPTSNLIIRKGMIRYLYIIIDYSKQLLNKEFSMNSKIRHEILLKLLSEFLRSFFDKNPLCQVGIICTRNGKASKICGLSGNHFDIIDKFKKYFEYIPSGEPSLENSLKFANNFLSSVPNYGSKEVLILYSGISTVDPGDICVIIKEMKKNRINCSVIGFGVKLYILEKITKETLGAYDVPNNIDELHRKLMSYTNPPSIQKENDHAKECIPMGFPIQKRSVLTPCFCHKMLKNDGYFCPRCNTKYCNIPVDCKICGLVLVSSFHIARSFHHLFPVKSFTVIKKITKEENSKFCYGCQKELPFENTIRTQCTDCQETFCIDCDVFIHENLHVCPGCRI